MTTSPVRFTHSTLASLAICMAASAALAGATTIGATGRGLTTTDPGGNYNTATNFYAAGQFGGTVARDHFDFSIPVGQWTSASLDLDEPTGGHIGGLTTTFSVYSINLVSNGLSNTYPFASLGAGTFYGSVTLSTSDNGTTVHIALNGTALADILADQGATFSIAGVDSGESSNNLDFASTDSNAHSTLTLISAATPEPGSITLMGIALAGLLGVRLGKTDRR